MMKTKFEQTTITKPPLTDRLLLLVGKTAGEKERRSPRFSPFPTIHSEAPNPAFGCYIGRRVGGKKRGTSFFHNMSVPLLFLIRKDFLKNRS
jgi:hypothetical protein